MTPAENFACLGSERWFSPVRQNPGAWSQGAVSGTPFLWVWASFLPYSTYLITLCSFHIYTALGSLRFQAHLVKLVHYWPLDCLEAEAITWNVKNNGNYTCGSTSFCFFFTECQLNFVSMAHPVQRGVFLKLKYFCFGFLSCSNGIP